MIKATILVYEAKQDVTDWSGAFVRRRRPWKSRARVIPRFVHCRYWYSSHLAAFQENRPNYCFATLWLFCILEGDVLLGCSPQCKTGSKFPLWHQAEPKRHAASNNSALLEIICPVGIRVVDVGSEEKTCSICKHVSKRNMRREGDCLGLRVNYSRRFRQFFRQVPNIRNQCNVLDA